MTIKELKLGELRCPPDPLWNCTQELSNWLTTIVRRFGALRPPVVNLRSNTVLDGRKLVSALRCSGNSHALCACLDIPIEDEQLVRMVLNNHASDWEWEAVSKLLKERKIPAELSGFKSFDYNPLLAAEWKPAQVDDSQFEMELN